MANLTCPAVELAAVDATSSITTSAKPRSANGTPRPATIHIAMPPSRNAGRLRMGLGRDNKRTAIPIRTGAAIATRASSSTVPHMTGTLPCCSGYRLRYLRIDAQLNVLVIICSSGRQTRWESSSTATWTGRRLQ